jgi:hypothetical protein
MLLLNERTAERWLVDGILLGLNGKEKEESETKIKCLK